jgi:hypothetical protein
LVESRFEALHPGGLTELVGREEELELLLRRWSKVKTGDGQVVLLSASANRGSPPHCWNASPPSRTHAYDALPG